MSQAVRGSALLAVAAFSTAACGSPLRELPAGDVNQEAGSNARQGGEQKVTSGSSAGAPINQRFRDLDAYLLHLEQTNGPIDKPFYREIRPGVYQRVGGNLRVLSPESGSEDGKSGTYTREELERKFGFRN